MTIKIRYHGDVTPLEKIPQGDWIDLRAAETVEMKAGEYRLISLGVSMQLPRGYEAHVAPRSSTFNLWLSNQFVYGFRCASRRTIQIHPISPLA